MTRGIVHGLCSPNRSRFRKAKAVGKWLVTEEEGGVETDYVCLVPSTFANVTRDFFSTNVTPK